MKPIEQISFKKKKSVVSVIILWPDMLGYEFLYNIDTLEFLEVYEVDASTTKTIHNIITINDIPIDLQIKIIKLININYEKS